MMRIKVFVPRITATNDNKTVPATEEEWVIDTRRIFGLQQRSQRRFRDGDIYQEAALMVWIQVGDNPLVLEVRDPPSIDRLLELENRS